MLEKKVRTDRYPMSKRQLRKLVQEYETDSKEIARAMGCGSRVVRYWLSDNSDNEMSYPQWFTFIYAVTGEITQATPPKAKEFRR